MMHHTLGIARRAVLVALVFVSGLAAGIVTAKGARLGQDMSLESSVYESPTGTRLRMLLDASNLGGSEVEVGEITLPAGANSGSHPHGSTEIFYVLEGELDHVVNGEHHLLKPGMLGFVRPPDEVTHIVPGDEPVRALVIWAPGGEADRIVSRWRKVP